MKITDFTEDIVYQWQKKWTKEDLQRATKNCEKDPVCLPYFLKYLPKNGFILEAGCGLGQWVIYLSRLGYQMIGVEIVPECIETCKKHFPEADVTVGDVRNLPFPDNYFSGYISIGVVEHMIEGPESTLKEMRRVLKPGGIAIFTIPSLNYFFRVWYPFRKILVNLFRYNRWIRRILGRSSYFYNKQKTEIKMKEIKKQLRPELYPIIGIDGAKGPLFIEYKYKRRQIDNFLKLFNFKIIESVPVYHPFIFRDTFGNLFFKNQKDNLQLNVFGKILKWFFDQLSPHFFNYIYLYVLEA